MSKPEPISIEDFDNRCQEHFPDSGERCWGLAVKVISIRGQRKAICLAHYEKWLEEVAKLATRSNTIK